MCDSIPITRSISYNGIKLKTSSSTIRMDF